MYKLGKLPARPGAIKFKLTTYLQKQAIPFKAGHYQLISKWGMLGNDQYGDCVLAGAGHETMLWNKTAGKDVIVDTPEALLAYHDITGFDPKDPSTDQGTDMELAAKWRRNTGILDTKSNRHKVAAYLDITAGNRDQLEHAIYYFGMAGIGIQFPQSAMDQFNSGKSWTVVANSPIEGGHYIPAVGYDSKYVYVVTWGKVQRMAWSFYQKYCDEAIAYISQDALKNGQTIDGFNYIQLIADLKSL